jgi:hypothetical protein
MARASRKNMPTTKITTRPYTLCDRKSLDLGMPHARFTERKMALNTPRRPDEADQGDQLGHQEGPEQRPRTAGWRAEAGSGGPPRRPPSDDRGGELSQDDPRRWDGELEAPDAERSFPGEGQDGVGERQREQHDAGGAGQDRIEDAVSKVNVPLAFYDEVYTLQEHIEFVRGKISRINQDPVEI